MQTSTQRSLLKYNVEFHIKNKTEKLIRLFNRAAYHCREMELRTESMLEGDYLDIKLTKSKTKKLS